MAERATASAGVPDTRSDAEKAADFDRHLADYQAGEHPVTPGDVVSHWAGVAVVLIVLGVAVSVLFAPVLGPWSLLAGPLAAGLLTYRVSREYPPRPRSLARTFDAAKKEYPEEYRAWRRAEL